MFNPAALTTPAISLSRRHHICQPQNQSQSQHQHLPQTPNPHQPHQQYQQPHQPQHNPPDHQVSNNNQSDNSTANNKSPYTWYFTHKNNQAGSAYISTDIKQLSVYAPVPVTTGCSLMNRTTKSSADQIFKILSTSSARTPNPAELALIRNQIPKATNSQQTLMWFYFQKQHQSEPDILSSRPVFEDNTSSKEHDDNVVLTIAEK